MMESPLAAQHTERRAAAARGCHQSDFCWVIIFGTVYALLPFTLPQMVTKTMSSLASPPRRCRFLSIGASFEGTKAIKSSGPTVAAAFIKTVGLAAVFLPPVQ